MNYYNRTIIMLYQCYISTIYIFLTRPMTRPKITIKINKPSYSVLAPKKKIMKNKRS